MNRCSCQSKRLVFRKAKVQSRSLFFRREILVNRKFVQELCSQNRARLIRELLLSVLYFRKKILSSFFAVAKLRFALYEKIKTLSVLPKSRNRSRVPSSPDCFSNNLHFIFSNDAIYYFRLLIFVNFSMSY